MPYLEVMKRKGKDHYFAIRNFRISGNRWRKVKRYLGTTRPDNATLKNAFDWIDREASDRGLIRTSRYRHLSEQDAERLQDLKGSFKTWYAHLEPIGREKFDTDFLIRFTYNTNAIEGNRLSLRETAMILTEDVVPSGGSLRDINETLNARDAMGLMRAHKGGLNRRFLLRLHGELTKDTGCRLVGQYRDSGVQIAGSAWFPPPADEVPVRMARLFTWYNYHKDRLHPVELGAIVHNRLVQVHPFTDGNGRTARLVMNWIVSSHGYPMFHIEKTKRQNYYEAIESSDKGDDRTFIKFIVDRILEEYTFVLED